MARIFQPSPEARRKTENRFSLQALRQANPAGTHSFKRSVPLTVSMGNVASRIVRLNISAVCVEIWSKIIQTEELRYENNVPLIMNRYSHNSFFKGTLFLTTVHSFSFEIERELFHPRVHSPDEWVGSPERHTGREPGHGLSSASITGHHSEIGRRHLGLLQPPLDTLLLTDLSLSCESLLPLCPLP